MNHTYRLVWSQLSNTWIAVAENVNGRGKSISGRKLIAAALALASPVALAAPLGGTVSAGTGAIAQSGATTTVTQQSQKLAIDWQSFSVGTSETVRFLQPNATSIALNRVLGQDPSRILGRIDANGQVFVLNPNGVLFGSTAQVNAGGLVASTLSLNNADFMAGKNVFSNAGGAGSVVNQGTLRAANRGYVALLAPEVRNEGIVAATLGAALLAAGDKVTLNLDNGSLLSYSVDQGSLHALAENRQLIQADGGQVILSARAADQLASAVVNNTGVIEARTIEDQGGLIRLLGDAQAGLVEAGGTLDVSSAGGKGGTVAVTGDRVRLNDGAHINATGESGGGTVLVGGGLRGQDTSVGNASAVVMHQGAVIDVSATGKGDGGTAVLWSQDYTAFNGTIRAKGGAVGGNGGMVETSSHDRLQALGVVDTGAPAGAAGNWLLDPSNVTIAESGASGTAYSDSFTPAADSVILASSIVSSLDAGTNVTITTGSTGSSAGDITVDAAIKKTGSSASTLTLSAANDVNVNAEISSSSGRLNAVLTSDADGSGAGNVNFGSGGRITTKGGNFYAGEMSGNNVTRKGQDLNMASGSFVDVEGGMLDILMNGTVTLADNSLRAGFSTFPNYNDGSTKYYYNYINVNADRILTSNADASTPDIVSTAPSVTLSAGTIGGSGAPIKISAGSSPASNTLYVNNTAGDSYISEIGQRAFSTISVNIGSQADSTHNVQIMGDAGGDGSTGDGHVILKTDSAGVLNIGTDNVRTGGSDNVEATNLVVSADNITFADRSVDVGDASFTASASSTLSSTQVNGVGDISGSYVTLNASEIGTATNPIELGTGYYLSLNNTGGSSYLKSVDNQFSSVSLTDTHAVGTHSLLYSNGDRINYSTDGSGIFLPTISGGASDGSTFGATTGIDVSHGNRSVTVVANSGDIILGDNSVNAGAGSFSAVLANGNSTGVIAAQNAYNAAAPVAQITAGDVQFAMYNNSSSAAIGGGGKDIQIAQGAGASNNTLSLNTRSGDVNIHELSPDHFKSIDVTLNGGHAAQNVAIDLNGPDDINFSDNGSLITLDAASVNLAANNRDWSFNAQSRSVQIDGTSVGDGSYSVASSLLKLNGDVMSNGGSIFLSGSSGIQLLKSVRVDSNADDAANTASTGYSGSIYLSGTISSSAGSHALTVDSGSTDSNGGQIMMYSGTANGGGDYLSGLNVSAKGMGDTSDGTIYYLGQNYYLNGDFTSTGNSYLLYPTTIDTEQGNVASAGNITFGGQNVFGSSYYGYVFNASTTAAGMNGGNVDLYGTYSHSPFSGSGMTVDTTGGAGGTSGSIDLPTVDTTYYYGSNTQSYAGGIITLHGDLRSDRGDITLNGDVRIANNVTIDTWQSTGSTQNGSAGSVTIDGAGLSAAAAGLALNIDTGTDTGADYYGGSSDWSHSAGNVSFAAGNSGGAYIDTLAVNTSVRGSHDTGTSGTITLNSVNTEGAQNYVGGATTISDGLTTNGGGISLAGVASVTLQGATVAFDTDRSGGTNDAGTLSFGDNHLNGAYALMIDTTADGGGAGADLTLSGIGDTTALTSVTAVAKNLTVGAAGIAAGGDMTLEGRGASSDVTLDGVVTSTGGNIVIAAGRDFVNNVSGTNTGIVASSGRYLVYAADPAGSTEGMSGYGKHYNQSYTAGSTPAYAASGDWFLYSIAPTITVSPSSPSPITYGSADPTLSASYSGLIDGDTTAALSGTPVLALEGYTASGAGHRPAGTYAITLSGTLTDSLGYQYEFNNGSLTVDPVSLTTSGVSAANKVYDGTVAATLGGTAAISALSGDAVTISGTASGVFADKNVGAGKDVTVSGYTLAGADAGNYVLTQPAGVTADITARALTVSVSGVDKVYDGTTAATIGYADNRVAGDVLVAAGTASFADKNAGSGKTVSVSDIGLSGTDAGNYTVNTTATTTADITARALTVSVSGVDKVYDGTTAATIGYADNRVAGDAFVAAGTASFADKNVGSGKTVSVSDIGLSGTDAGNYTVNTTATTTADITARALTVSVNGVDKVYDGTTAATVGYADNRVAGDALVAAGTAAFADKNAGSGKTISVSGIGLSGTDAGNYTVNTTATTTADITPAALTITARDKTKIYDGVPFSGGNGVDYLGFVDNESASVLNGVLAYGGTSQGALNFGTYSIVPGGLSSGNYTINYVDGVLTLNPLVPVQAAAAFGGTTVLPNYNGAVVVASESTPPAGTSPKVQVADVGAPQGGTVSIENGGIRLPDDGTASQQDAGELEINGK